MRFSLLLSLTLCCQPLAAVTSPLCNSEIKGQTSKVKNQTFLASGSQIEAASGCSVANRESLLGAAAGAVGVIEESRASQLIDYFFLCEGLRERLPPRRSTPRYVKRPFGALYGPEGIDGFYEQSFFCGSQVPYPLPVKREPRGGQFKNQTSRIETALGRSVTNRESPSCSLTLSGRLLSEHDDESLAYATVYGQTAGRGIQADSAGNFAFTGLCEGKQAFTFTHIGCDGETLTLDIRRDTQITVYLHHHDNYTETVTVSATANAGYSRELDERAPQQLTDALERITGVSSLRAGTSASKPVFDGVFGNRLSVQNNGIAQSGQQWGNDHAPEIDPWIAAYVRVVEGVEALKYAGPTVAATVLIEPAPLREDEETAGKVAYGFQSNGRGHTLNARISGGERLAYRLSMSGKYSGDQQAPDYYLANTGRREGNLALQLAYFHNPKWTTRAYYSNFNAGIGVLRGAHVGNLTDLEFAINREEPFFTTDTFTYRLNSPKQVVSHHLAKVETEFRPNEDHRFTFRYGGQLNIREEFDVRRGELNDMPALSLQQFNHLFEGAWHHELGPDRHLDANLQYEFTFNDNEPGTGVLPLIPDYNANRASGYLAYHQEGQQFQYHAGLRFDRQFYEAITISRDLPRRIERFEHVFSTIGVSFELRRKLGKRTSLRAGLTLRQRAPQINELYSNGLHQGVSGIEEGDRTLAPEQSVKLTAGLLFVGDRLTLNAGLFAQPIKDYIFLEPQPDFRLTIRGAFPVFLYRAGDALLYGANLRAFYVPHPKWEFDGRMALVRGQNRAEEQPLIFMPSDNLRLGLSHAPASGWKFAVDGLFVARQTRLDADQDFLVPPPGYALFDLSISREIGLPSDRSLYLRAAAQNIFNTRYRDYLDRQRYFADATGRNLSVRISYKW
ncbi:MAG: iron complex outermembrane receptor protein [Neolewinella sp.]|jgi:iron complex outermembrane receptor protein